MKNVPRLPAEQILEKVQEQGETVNPAVEKIQEQTSRTVRHFPEARTKKDASN